jgi:hypothetical protein
MYNLSREMDTYTNDVHRLNYKDELCLPQKKGMSHVYMGHLQVFKMMSCVWGTSLFIRRSTYKLKAYNTCMRQTHYMHLLPTQQKNTTSIRKMVFSKFLFKFIKLNFLTQSSKMHLWQLIV